MDAETLFNAAGPPRHSAANTVFRTYKHSAVVDVETPGQHRNDSIVEVAVVVVDRKGRIRDEWETLINPGGWPIGADASRTHGLYTTHLGRAPSFRDVGEALVRWLEGNVVVCDSRFHRSFLERELAAAGADADLGEGIDIGTLLGPAGPWPESRGRAMGDARAIAAEAVRWLIAAGQTPRRLAGAKIKHSFPHSRTTLTRSELRRERGGRRRSRR